MAWSETTGDEFQLAEQQWQQHRFPQDSKVSLVTGLTVNPGRAHLGCHQCRIIPTGHQKRVHQRKSAV